jgi:hypothetical protein
MSKENAGRTRADSDLAAALFAGSVAALCSSAVVTLCGHLENRRALAPHNGPAQWIYGTQAAHRREVSCSHTLVGYAIHHLSSVWWAYVQRRLFPARHARSVAAHLGQGAITAVMANIVDYKVVPKRLQPGFEKHISRTSLVAVYAAFGVGLALGSYLLQPNAEQRRE